MSRITSHFKIHSTSAGTLGASAVLCVNVLEANLDLYLVRLEFHLLKHQHIEDQQKWPHEYCHCAKGLRGTLRHPVSSLWGLCHGNGVSTVRRQFGESAIILSPKLTLELPGRATAYCTRLIIQKIIMKVIYCANVQCWKKKMYMGIWVWSAVSSMLEAELSLTGSWCLTSKCFCMFLKAISECYMSLA